MTSQTTKHALALAKVESTASDIAKAVDAHHAAMVRAVAAGCTQAQLSAVLGVSRQAISQYIKRWITTEPASRPSGATLF